MHVTQAQQKKLNQLGITFMRKQKDGNFIVSLFDAGGTLRSMGVSANEIASLDVALAGYVATYGDKPQLTIVADAAPPSDVFAEEPTEIFAPVVDTATLVIDDEAVARVVDAPTDAEPETASSDPDVNLPF